MLKFLIDMPLSPSLAKWLANRGHDAVHVAAIHLAQAPDPVILQRARDESRIVLTADLDFPRLLATAGALSPPIILLRGGSYSESEMIDRIAAVLSHVSEKDIANSFIVVDRHRVRKRRLPLK